MRINSNILDRFLTILKETPLEDRTNLDSIEFAKAIARNLPPNEIDGFDLLMAEMTAWFYDVHNYFEDHGLLKSPSHIMDEGSALDALIGDESTVFVAKPTPMSKEFLGVWQGILTKLHAQDPMPTDNPTNFRKWLKKNMDKSDMAIFFLQVADMPVDEFVGWLKTIASTTPAMERKISFVN